MPLKYISTRIDCQTNQPVRTGGHDGAKKTIKIFTNVLNFFIVNMSTTSGTKQKVK